jgi:putative copper resistance protein D
MTFSAFALRCRLVLAVAILALAFSSAAAFAPVARAQEHDPAMHEHAGHEGMNMPAPPADPALAAADRELQLAWKKESEANHHIAGVLVIIAGLFILAEPAFRQRFPFLRFIWPLCFLFGGIYLLIFSDTELWPFGTQSWWYGLTHNTEDLQHKTFAVILLGLAFIEIQRARGVLKAAWAAWVFPVLAVFGSILVLFHEHHSGMGGADHMAHMAVMRRIQSEHLAFSITGVGIALTKGLSEVRFNWQSVFAKLWPVLMIVLGILLTLYTE